MGGGGGSGFSGDVSVLLWSKHKVLFFWLGLGPSWTKIKLSYVVGTAHGNLVFIWLSWNSLRMIQIIIIVCNVVNLSNSLQRSVKTIIDGDTFLL